MRLFIEAIAVTFEMLGIFFSAFLVVYLVALFLSPIENRLTAMVWRHTNHEEQEPFTKPSFKQFSHRLR